MSTPSEFVCGCCGQTFENWPLDVSFNRPDEIWKMPEDERAKRAWESSDLCVLDDAKFYLRGVLYVPLIEHDEKWGIGLWVQVSQDNFERYMRLYDVDGSLEAPFEGLVANNMPAFGGVLGETVQVRLGNSKQRPTFVIDANEGISTSQIGMAQMNGISDITLHQILDIFTGKS